LGQKIPFVLIFYLEFIYNPCCSPYHFLTSSCLIYQPLKTYKNGKIGKESIIGELDKVEEEVDTLNLFDFLLPVVSAATVVLIFIRIAELKNEINFCLIFIRIKSRSSPVHCTDAYARLARDQRVLLAKAKGDEELSKC
jgi:hypothetical protein